MDKPTPAGEEVKHQPDFVLRILVEWKDEDAAWVAHCLELDLVAVAPERWKAVQSLAVVIQAQIMAGLERGWEESIPFAAPKKYFDRFEERAKSLRPASPPPSAPTSTLTADVAQTEHSADNGEVGGTPVSAGKHPSALRAASAPDAGQPATESESYLFNHKTLDNLRVAIKQAKEICARCNKPKSDDRHTPCDEMCYHDCGCHIFEPIAAPSAPASAARACNECDKTHPCLGSGCKCQMCAFWWQQRHGMRVALAPTSSHATEFAEAWAEQQTRQLREERNYLGTQLVGYQTVEHEVRTILGDDKRHPVIDLARKAIERAQAAEAERDKAKQTIADAHQTLDGIGVESALGKACSDPECESHLVHRIKELAAERLRK